MANTFQLYTGDGVNKNFGVPFPYLDKSHVKVSIDGVETSAFTWLTDSMIQLAVAAPNLSVVDVRRETPTGVSPVDFVDGSILSEVTLDLVALYSAYVAAEARDYVDGALRGNTTGSWDATGRKIVNVAPGVLPTDAATKGQVDSTLMDIAAELDGVVADAHAAVAVDVATAADAALNAASSATQAGEEAADSHASAVLAASYAQLSYINDYGLITGATPDITDYGNI